MTGIGTKFMTSSTTKGKIEKLDMTDSTNYIAWIEGAISLPDRMSEETKQAVMIFQNKINEIIDRLNELERTKHG